MYSSLQLKAEEGQKSALSEKEKAEAARLEAERFALLADQNSKEAIKAKEEATRFRMLAIAQAMGAKAVQLQDKDQKVLVAQQAYLFNKQYGGYQYQTDIYNGLYSAFEAVNGDRFNSTTIHKGAVNGMISISANTFITAGADGKIIKTIMGTTPATVSLVETHPYIFQSIALSLDKRIFAVGSEEGKLLVYDVASLKKLNEINAHKSSLWAIVFDEQGAIYTSGNDKEIIKWSTETYQPTLLTQLSSAVNSLSYYSNFRLMVAGLENGSLILMQIKDVGLIILEEVPTGKSIAAIEFRKTIGTSATIENPVMAIGLADGSILLQDLVYVPGSPGRLGLQFNQSLSGHKGRVSSLQFDNQNNFLISTSYDGTSMLWNMKFSINAQQVVFPDHGGWVLQGCFDPDGRDLITADVTGNLRYFALDMDYYSNNLCEKMNRDMTQKEWINFVGDDIPYSKTCVK